MTADDDIKITFRADDWMDRRLKAVARANGRSVNDEIVQRLEASLVDNRWEEMAAIIDCLAPPEEKVN